MLQTFSFEAPGRAKYRPVVILSGIDMCRKSSTFHFRGIVKMMSLTFSKASAWARTRCTAKNILRGLFCQRVAAVVSIVGISAMLWHSMSIVDVIERQAAVGMDCLCMLPWGLVWALNSTRKTSSEKEGRK